MPQAPGEQSSGVKKVLKACERCRALKVKCSGTHPCSRCTRGKHPCIFSSGSKRISVSESYLRYLESQRQPIPPVEMRTSSAHQEVSHTSGAPRTNISHAAGENTVDSIPPASRQEATDTIEDHPGATHPSGPEVLEPAGFPENRTASHNLGSGDVVDSIQVADAPNAWSPSRDAPSEHRNPDLHSQALNGSRRSTSPVSTVGSPFRQNPLADNDYTFARMDGRFWYMGPSSSWSFCRRVFALLGKLQPESAYLNDPGYLDGSACRLRWKLLGDDETPDTSNLPPLDFALFLFNTAKFYLGTIFHVIDEEDFLRNMHELYDNPQAKASSSRHWFAQYLLILAFGKTFIVHQTCPIGPPGYQYAVRALSLMPDLSGLAPNAVHAVQALVLGALYLQSIDMRVGSLQHLGHALRICIIEGWHRHMPDKVVGFEHSRRCNIIFWMVYMLDREFGPLMGAPSSIRDEDITAKQPSELDNSMEANNFTLHVRLSRLMPQILTQIYGVGKEYAGTLITNTQDVLQQLAHLSKDINELLSTHFQGSVNKASRIALRLILGYHHCIVLTTRPLVMCALNIHVRQSDTMEPQNIQLSKPVYSLLQSCVESAQTILRILRVVGDEELLEAFLPFQLEDAFSSGYILCLIRAICPSLVQNDAWRENVDCVLDKMISKGSVVAPFRKEELGHLTHVIEALTPHGDVFQGHTLDAPGEQIECEATPGLPVLEDVGWDLFLADQGMGMSPQHILDLAGQLGFEQNFDLS